KPTRPCQRASGPDPTVTRPLSPSSIAAPVTVTFTGPVPGLTTRRGTVPVAPGAIVVGSGGTDTASGRGPPCGVGAASAPIGLATMSAAASPVPNRLGPRATLTGDN